ncbi:MAG: polysaccharide deacetylase family protein [Omnitrophica bacterium]|nr:polysaccharide deacetylase family protein [Candidatus Omnitrophota bacterium]
MRLRKILIIFGLIIALSISSFCFYVFSSKYVVPILMYHHIDENAEASSLSVSSENFRQQMRFLSRRSYNVISLKDFIEIKEKKLKFPRNTVVITFDDGYEDNYIAAYPLLREYNLPATIFVIVDSLGKKGYLSYAQIKEMKSSMIIDIGSHTLEGDYLPGRSKDQLKREIGLSKKKLQAALGKKIDFFCYPLGGFSPRIQEIVKKYGYSGACATNRGYAQTHLNDDIFALKRIKIKDSFPNLFVFWVKLSGYYNLFRRVREPY